MIRTYKIVNRKNWVLQPSKWNTFWTNLELDIQDLKNDIANTNISYTYLNSTIEETMPHAKIFKRSNYPNI